MATAINKVLIQADASQLINEYRKVDAQTKKTSDSFSDLKGVLATVASTAFITSAYQLANSLNDISKASGVALSNVIGFGKAVQVNGGNIEGANQAIGRFNQFISTAAEGNKKAQDSFLSLGISLEELRTLSEQDLLKKFISGLANTDDVARRTAIGVEAFGKSFRSVDFKGVNADFEKFTALSQRNADAVAAAGETSDNFKSAINELQIQLLAALKPVSELANSILSASEGVGTFLKVIAQIGVVVASFTILGKAAQVVGASWGVLVSIAASVGTAFGVLRNLFVNFGLVLENLGLLGFAGQLRVLKSLFADLLGWVVKNIPAIGALGVGLSFVADWASGLWNSLKKLLGFKMDEPMANWGEGSKDQADYLEQYIKNAREVESANKALQDSLNKLTNAYASGNIEYSKRFELETSLIKMSDAAKLSATERFNLESKYLTEVGKLQEDYAAKAKSNSETDKAALPLIAQAIKDVTAEYEKQLSSVNSLVEARIKEQQIQQLNLFTNKASVDAQAKLRDIQNDIARTVLPELEKRYYDLAAARQAEAEAEIAAEEQRRNSKLTDQEKLKYYEAATAGLEAQRQSTLQLYNMEIKRDQRIFAQKKRIDLENDLYKIQDETRKSVLPELQRKYYDIEAAARDAAKAQIDAQEVALGRKLNADEQQAYYDAATAGVERLKRATKESYETSRSFSTGWKKAFNDYIDSATNAAKTAENLFNKAMGGIEDALVNFVKTGKFEWKSFVASMAEELLRSQIRETFASIMTGMQSGGGILGSIGSLFGLGSTNQAGAQRGQNAAQPLYVLDVSNSGVGAAAALPGATSSFLGGLGNLFPMNQNSTNDIQRQISGGGIGGGGGGFFGGIADAASSIFDGIGSFFGGGSNNSDSGGSFSDLFDGLFANGGTIGAGRFGIAGEAGPELIGGPATVMPMTGSSNVTYNINAVDASSFKALVAQDPGFIHAVVMQGAKSMPGSRR